MVNDREAGSYPRRIRHLPDDHCGQVGRALCPYLPGLEVQVGQRLVGFRPYWSLRGHVGARSVVVNGLHVHAIRPYVWPALPAKLPSLDASGETGLRWADSLGF